MTEDEGVCFVPSINEEELHRRLALFTPLYRDNGVVHRIKIPDLCVDAFTWDPDLLEAVEFTPVTTIQTHHYCAFYGFFKPSIEEVLAQVPDDIPEGVNAFYIDMTADLGIFREGNGHLATTIFGTI
jgi:hypothetical protein